MSQGPPTSGGGIDPQQQPAVPAGWYPHPTAPGWEAYWDGSAWGAETRPAQAAAPAAPEPVAAQEPASAQPAEQPYVAEQPAEQQYTQQEPAAGEPAQADQPAAVPAAATGAAAAVPAAAGTQGAAVPSSQAVDPVAQQPVAVPATAAPAAAKRSDSSLPLVLCLLGAIVAIVGSFLPMATSDIDSVDIADNTLVAAGYGIAVIALAVLGAGVAAYFYLKARSTWLPILLGAVIVAIAAYVGLAGLDSLTPEVVVPASVQNVDPKAAGALAAAASDAGAELDGTASTGIFAAGVGGLLMVLGGIGLARPPK
jgi:Protein of unknown function (DUF2510)